jgi:hypothetical protein
LALVHLKAWFVLLDGSGLTIAKNLSNPSQLVLLLPPETFGQESKNSAMKQDASKYILNKIDFAQYWPD